MLLRTMRALALAAFVVLLLQPQGAGAQTSLTSPAVRSAIDAVVAKARTVYGGRSPVPAVLIGVWNPMGSYVRAYGVADLATHRALSTADHFRIGSNTKTFVISVLLQLVDEKRLGLDDPLSTFALGVTIPNARHITVREVCQMRSGLFEAYNTPQIDRMNVTGATTFNPRTLVRWAVEQKPLFAPGTRYNYSNTNYLILGLLIESITKDTVTHQIQTRLLDRFGLTQTSYPATQAMPDPWAHGYALDPNKNWQDVSGTIPVSLMGPAGEMISTMRDMRRWVTLYVTGKTSAPATQRQRLACKYTGEANLYFGLGIGCSAGYYGYTGGLPGYNTANYYMPSTGTMILAWVPLQAHVPKPGVANAIFSNIARLLTPQHVPFNMTGPSTGAKSGL
jgi:D-alanyl-D-alanine carboxypeptidase